MTQMSSIKEAIRTDPYPGLRAFKYNEAHLFFGRDEQVDKLLERIQGSHFVAVVGPSGCGKSSLVKAGLIPALKTGVIIEAGSKWRIAEMRPGDKPFYNLSKALSRSFNNNNTAVECIKAELRRGPKGLVEFLNSEDLYNENFLLIVDQFEELFRYKQNNNIDEVTAFIALLIESAKQRGISLHIVITMRSDFLGDCSLFPGLPEILNDNQFLTPRLTREQTKEAIEGPALVCGGYLDPQLVNTLLNDIGVDHDQLPLLQHALMRMWSHAKEVKYKNNSVETTSDDSAKTIFLTSDDYIAVGKLNNALSKHANLIYDTRLTKEQQKITEILFRRLSERNIEQKDIRRPSAINDIAAVAEVSPEEVIEVASFYMAADYNFLTLSSEGSIEPNSYIDIAHESIMRQWDKMIEWIAKEYEAAARYKRFVADAEDYYNGKGELLGGIDLENVLLWKKENNINKAWALRYSDRYEQVENFIKDSKIQSERRNYTLFTFLGILMIIFFLFAFNSQRNKAKVSAERELLALKYTDSLKRISDTLSKTNTILKSKQNELEEASAEKLKNQKEKLELEAKNKIEILKRSKSEKEKAIVQDLVLKLKKEVREKDSTIYITIIQNLPSYSRLDSNDRSLAIDDLLPLYRENKTLQIKEFVDSINDWLDLQDYPFENSIASTLTKARKIWEKTNRPVIKSLISKFIKGNVFYKEEIAPAERNYYSKSLLAFTNDKNHFVIKNHNNFTFGNYKNDTLTIVRNLIDKKDSSYNNVSDNIIPSFISTDGIAYKENKVIELQVDGKLVEINTEGDKETYSTIPYNNKLQQAEFSPDGNFLITAPNQIINRSGNFNDKSIKLWKLESLKIGKELLSIILDDSITSAIKYLSFSPNNKHLLILYENHRLKVWNTDGKDLGFDTTRKISSASFTPEGNRILILTPEGNGKILDLAGASTDYKDFSFPLTYYYNPNLYLSPDWKRIIAWEDRKKPILYETINGDSIISQYKKINLVEDSIVVAKTFAVANPNFNKVQFLENNAIITSGLYGSVYLWKTYPFFNSIEKAFSTIEVPPLRLEEKIEEDSIYFKRILTITNVKKLDSIASVVSDYYNDYRNDKKNRIIYGDLLKDIYKKLIEISPGSRKNSYVKRVISLNQAIVGVEQNKDDPNHELIVEKLKENAGLSEDMFKMDSSAGAKFYLSSTYWNLSWNLLFIKEFVKARQAALRGIELHPDNNGINTNLALAYLLDHKFIEAEAIYQKYKGEKYKNKERFFTTSFLQDFKELEDAKIISPKEPDIYNKVKEIRKMLITNK